MSLLQLHLSKILGIASVLFMLVFSFWHLTTQPRIWVDESLNIDIAHNILLSGTPNVATGPDEFPPRPYMIATTGYAVTAPLALVFKVFGFGVLQARVYMLAWMLVFLVSLWYVVGNMFSRSAAISAILLTVTFATFYDIGRTVVGELPGFVFLLWGLYNLSRFANFGLAGLMLGLAVSTKPSLYLSLVLVGGIFLWCERKRLSMQNTGRLVIGGSVPILIWVGLFFPHPLSVETWREAVSFFADPFGKSLVANLTRRTLPLLVSSSTIIYFGLMGIAAAVAYGISRKELSSPQRIWTRSMLMFALLGLVYFLRSPGWLRYLFGAELALYTILYPSIERYVGWLRTRIAVLQGGLGLLVPPMLLACFVVVQTVQLFFYSSILASRVPEEVSASIRNNLGPGERVGILNMPYVAVLVPKEQRYQQFYLTGEPLVGANPLTLSNELLPELLIFRESDRARFITLYADRFNAWYRDMAVIGSVSLYRKNKYE